MLTVLLLLLCLRLPVQFAQQFAEVEETCDPFSDEAQQGLCGLQEENLGLVADNDTSRFEREVQEGLHLPSLEDCPEDLMLSRMVARVLQQYFPGCVPVLRYDRFLEGACGVKRLLSGALAVGLTHGRLAGTVNGVLQSPVPRDGNCATPVFLLQHVEDAMGVSRAGTSHAAAMVLVTSSPLWRVEEFINRWEQRPWKMVVIADASRPRPTISTKFLTPWFPYHVTVVTRHEPPYSIHRPNETDAEWTGIEPTLLGMLSGVLNFTYTVRIMPEQQGSAVVRETVESGAAELGCGGLYSEFDSEEISSSVPFTQDCAVFMTRASTALPRHRAILGPFRLAVWLTLTATYMLLMLFSGASPHSNSKPKEAQSRFDAFWLVYGTFTNSFVIRTRIWSDRASARLLLTFYWVFTVIITAAYTSSIIAFVTMPVFPDTIDSAEEILDERNFKWGTLGGSGWDKWFQETDDLTTRHIQAGFEWVPSVEEGVINVTKSSQYAFLGSRERLHYESSDDLAGALTGKKTLHLGSQCFLPLLPSLIATPALRPALDIPLLRFIQSGMVVKAQQDVEWQEQRRRLRNTATGVMRTEFSRTMPHERRLGLEDVVGTFLVLGAGLLMGLFSLGVEAVTSYCRVNNVAARVTNKIGEVRRSVVSRSRTGSSGGSSRLSLPRLRSGRIWSRTSRRGSVLDVVPERTIPETPAHVQNGYNGDCWAASAPALDRAQIEEENLDSDSMRIRLQRPQSSS